MKKIPRKSKILKENPPVKRRRGRPRLSEAEKTADPVRKMLREIKGNLKIVKKFGKRLDLLLGKAQKDQSVLLAALLDGLEKVKAELKKKPKKVKKQKPGKRGRPRKNPVGRPRKNPVGRPAKKRGRKPGRKPGRPAIKKAAGMPMRKRGRPKKIAPAKIMKPKIKKPAPAETAAKVEVKTEG